MIKVSILYPRKPGSRFDADYYTKVHMPMAAELLAAGIESASVEIGVAGATPEEPPAFWAICGFTSNSAEAFSAAFLPNATQLQKDIPNYTDVEPIIQISRLSLIP